MAKRTCRHCGSSLPGGVSAQRKYCDLRCREAAKYRRKRDALGLPPKIRYERCMADPKCGRPIYAKAKCKTHYEKSRGTYRRFPVLEAGCVARRFGTEPPKITTFFFKHATGIVAYCPWCGRGAAAETKAKRFCPYCGTQFTINIEEALWVSSQTPSTRPSRRAA